MLKSSVTSNLFQDFVSSYQSFQSSDSPESYIPFVFVSEGCVKLLTNVVDQCGDSDGIFATSMAENGYMEFLALQE